MDFFALNLEKKNIKNERKEGRKNGHLSLLSAFNQDPITFVVPLLMDKDVAKTTWAQESHRKAGLRTFQLMRKGKRN